MSHKQSERLRLNAVQKSDVLGRARVATTRIQSRGGKLERTLRDNWIVEWYGVGTPVSVGYRLADPRLRRQGW